MRIYSRLYPNTIEEQYNGDYRVMIDIEPYKDEHLDGYVGRALLLRPSQMNYGTIVDGFIRDRYSLSEEDALVNAYNASIMGISKNEKKEEEYREFLQWRVEMMSTVKEALSTFVLPNDDPNNLNQE